MKRTKGGQMDERVMVRVSADLKQAIQKAADEDRRGFSDMVRLILEDWVEAQKKGGQR